MKFSPSQAHYALNVLISQGKLRIAHIRKALKNREREIRSLRERLAALEHFAPAAPERAGRKPGRPARAGRKPGRPAGAARNPRIRRINMSPRVHALRQLQGKYMGYVRRLNPAEKARVRSVREKQGIEAAIRLAKSFAAKP
jgi:hypothetical protein